MLNGTVGYNFLAPDVEKINIKPEGNDYHEMVFSGRPFVTALMN